jgi:integrase
MKAARSKESKNKPWKVVARGSVKIPIYKGHTRVKRQVNGESVESTYDVFTIAYYEGGQRRRVNVSDSEKAEAKAEEIANALARGEADALKFTSHERAMLVQSQEMLRPLGKAVNIAVSEYVDAVTRLPQGVTLARVVDAYLERNKTSITPKSVREVVEEMIAAKENAKKSKDEQRLKRGDHLSSEAYVEDLRCRLGAFATAFQMNMGDVTWNGVQLYLDNLKDGRTEKPVSGRTKLNHFRHIAGLMRFAARRKYIEKDLLDELDAVETPDDEETDIQIFTPDEVRLLFEVVRPEMVPWLAIAAFAGLRTAELQRLDWSDIDLAERYIEVTAAKAKTGSRRLVPISENLLQWLAPCKRDSGAVTPFENMGKQIGWLTEAANDELSDQAEQSGKKAAVFKWKRNGLRHSFISYRLAILKDVGAVSLEAGNSPQMVFKHYRQLVTEAEAKKWFSVLPPTTDKIVALPALANSVEPALAVNQS